jgi:NAD(P)-dependent dehydrogenase (short-subunit alcohol dehydrogenase family)
MTVETLAGQVAFITGAARGQGRAHAVRLAADGAAIIALDICAEFGSTDYKGATIDDLAETVRLVEQAGGRILARQADVRDGDAVDAVLAEGLGEFGRLDIVIANAGIIRITDTDDRRGTFRDIIDVNLVGAWNSVDAAIPALIDGGRGGSIVLVSSTQGIKASGTERAGLQAYGAAKRGLVALMQGWASQLAPYSIRTTSPARWPGWSPSRPGSSPVPRGRWTPASRCAEGRRNASACGNSGTRALWCFGRSP